MADPATDPSETVEETTGDERWTSLDLARRVAAFADDKKAVGTLLVNVEEAIQVTDWFVITGGRNRRHISVIAEHVAKELKKDGVHRMAGTPFNDEHWVVLDFGSVVLHVFSPQAREFYDLENLWGECERVPWQTEAAPDAAADAPSADSE